MEAPELLTAAEGAAVHAVRAQGANASTQGGISSDRERMETCNPGIKEGGGNEAGQLVLERNVSASDEVFRRWLQPANSVPDDDTCEVSADDLDLGLKKTRAAQRGQGRASNGGVQVRKRNSSDGGSNHVRRAGRKLTFSSNSGSINFSEPQNVLMANEVKDEEIDVAEHRSILALGSRSMLVSSEIQKMRDLAQADRQRQPVTSMVWGLSPLKLWAVSVVSHQDFELLILILICLNCTSMALYQPLQPSESGRNRILGYLEIIFNIVFTGEVVLEVLAAGGLWKHIRKPWNAFDFCLVLAGYSALLPIKNSGASGIRALRALRSLRPLRTINRLQNLRAVVVSFVEALPMLTSVVGLLCFTIFLFAIVGVQLFQDVYHKQCYNPDTQLMEDPFGTEEFSCGRRRCPDAYPVCQKFDQNLAYMVSAGFDNVVASMETVFQCITISAWSYVAYRAMDATHFIAITYFVLLILFVSYIVMNLFLAVLKLKLAKAQAMAVGQQPRRSDSKLPHTDLEHRHSHIGHAMNNTNSLMRLFCWLSSLGHRLYNRMTGPAQVHPESSTVSRFGKFRAGLHGFVEGHAFNNFFLLCILVNTVMLGVEHDGMSEALSDGLNWGNFALTMLFVGEFVLKLVGLGFFEYFSDSFQVFDFVVVSISLIETTLLGGSSGVTALRSLRTFRVFKSLRVLRVFKAFKHFRALQKISEVLGASVGAFSAIGMLIVLFLVIFAIIGLQVFGQEQLDIDFPNFQTFFNSFVLVFQVMTLEDWHELMFSTVRCTNWGSALFFISWVILGKFVFLTLFLAVVMEAFERSYDMVDREIAEEEAEQRNAELQRQLQASRSGLNNREQIGRSILRSRSMAWNRIQENGGSLVTARRSKILSTTSSGFKTPSALVVAAADLADTEDWALALEHLRGCMETPCLSLQNRSKLHRKSGAVLRSLHWQSSPKASSANLPEHGSSGLQHIGAAGRHAQQVASRPPNGGGEALSVGQPGSMSYVNDLRTLLVDLAARGSEEDLVHSQQIQLEQTLPSAPGSRSLRLPLGDVQQRRGHSAGDGPDMDTARDRPQQEEDGEEEENEEEEEAQEEPQRLRPQPATVTDVPERQSAQRQPPNLQEDALHDAGARTPPSQAVGGSARDGPVSEGLEDGGREWPDGIAAKLQQHKTGGVGATGRQEEARQAASLELERIEPQHSPTAVQLVQVVRRGDFSTDSCDAAVETGPRLAQEDSGVFLCNRGCAAAAPPPSSAADRARPLSAGGEAWRPAAALEVDDSFERESQAGSRREGEASGDACRSHRSVLLVNAAHVPDAPHPATQLAAGASLPARCCSGALSGSIVRRIEDLGRVRRSSDGRPDSAQQRLKPCGSKQAGVLRLLVGDAALDAGQNASSRESASRHVLFLNNGGFDAEKTPTALATPSAPQGLLHDSFPEIESSEESQEEKPNWESLVLEHPAFVSMITSAIINEEESIYRKQYGRAAVWWRQVRGVLTGSQKSNWSALDGTGSRICSLEVRAEYIRQLEALQDMTSSSVVPLKGNSFCVFSPDSNLRHTLFFLVNHFLFTGPMHALVLLSCALLVLEDPGHDKSTRKAFWWLDVSFNCLFFVEMLMKMIAFSVKEYMKYRANQIDALIVLTTLLAHALESMQLRYIRSFRVLRVLRPVLMINRNHNMKTLVTAITQSLGNMTNVSIIVLGTMLIFGILGVQVFSGKFKSCNDTSVEWESDCVGEFTDPLTNQVQQRAWNNKHFNFDHLGNALTSLFVTLSLDGYLEIMYSAMATRERGQQPKDLANPWAFFYFFAYIVVCQFCLLNMYIGVVFYQFTKIKRIQSGLSDLSEKQRQWLALANTVFGQRVPPAVYVPTSRLRSWCFEVVNKSQFELLVNSAIVINMLLMAIPYYGLSNELFRALEIGNQICSAFFLLELTLKVLGFGWPRFIHSDWNKFDLALVLVSVLDFFMNSFNTNLVRVVRLLRVRKALRLLRVSRLFKLIRGSQGIQTLMDTLFVSLRALWHVLAVISVVFFMYAYAGVLLFAKVRHGEHLNEHANFETFPRSMLTLLRVATNDEWTGIMADCWVQPPNCSRRLGDCGNAVSPWYFISFGVVLSTILLNLFTTVVIEHFEAHEEKESWPITALHIEAICQLWSTMDDGSGSITIPQLVAMVNLLPEPLGVSLNGSREEAKAIVRQLLIPRVFGGRLGFEHTLYELVRRPMETPLPEDKPLTEIFEEAKMAYFTRANERYRLDLNHLFSGEDEEEEQEEEAGTVATSTLNRSTALHQRRRSIGSFFIMHTQDLEHSTGPNVQDHPNTPTQAHSAPANTLPSSGAEFGRQPNPRPDGAQSSVELGRIGVKKSVQKLASVQKALQNVHHDGNTIDDDALLGILQASPCPGGHTGQPIPPDTPSASASPRSAAAIPTATTPARQEACACAHRRV